jgi:hypothetical protein
VPLVVVVASVAVWGASSSAETATPASLGAPLVAKGVNTAPGGGDSANGKMMGVSHGEGGDGPSLTLMVVGVEGPPSPSWRWSVPRLMGDEANAACPCVRGGDPRWGGDTRWGKQIRAW